METAGCADLRGDTVLPYVLPALGKPKDPALRDAVAKLRAWLPRRLAAKGRQPRRRLRAHRGRPDHGRLVAAARAGPVRADPRQGRSTIASSTSRTSTTTPNNHGDHLGLRLPGRHLRAGAEGPAHAARPQAPGARASRGTSPGSAARYSRIYCGGTKRRRGDAAPLPQRARLVPEERARRGRPAALRRRRHLHDPARPRPHGPAPQGVRPVLLRPSGCARSAPRSSRSSTGSTGRPSSRSWRSRAVRRARRALAALAARRRRSLGRAAAAADARVLQAETVLPPGQSGFVSIAGVAIGHRLAAPQRPDRAVHVVSATSRRCSTSRARPRAHGPGVTIVRGPYGVPVDHRRDRLRRLVGRGLRGGPGPAVPARAVPPRHAAAGWRRSWATPTSTTT